MLLTYSVEHKFDVQGKFNFLLHIYITYGSTVISVN